MGKKGTGFAKGRKQTTIKHKIRMMILGIVSVSLIILGTLSCWLNYVSTMNTMKNSLMVTAGVAAGQVEYRLKATMNIVKSLGTVEIMSDTSETVLSDKKELLAQYVKDNGDGRMLPFSTQMVPVPWIPAPTLQTVSISKWQ
jgi:hypothetical protein